MDEGVIALFTKVTGMDREIAEILAREGYTSIEEIAWVPVNEIASIRGVDTATYLLCRQRARDFIQLSAP